MTQLDPGAEWRTCLFLAWALAVSLWVCATASYALLVFTRLLWRW